MDQKLLVVVSIVSARNFPRRPGCSILIDAQLNGELLTSDPIAHSSGVIQISTELAFEMTKKAFQQRKLHRTPIKLLVYAMDNITKARQKVGYVMLDLRSAQAALRSEPSWYGVLNSTYSRLKPQLHVQVSIEEEDVKVEHRVKGEQKHEVKGEQKQPESLSNTVALTLTLDPSGDFYVLGTPSKDHLMYTVSLTLHNAQHLPRLLHNHSSQLHFYYSLLGNDITSEPFTPPTFPAERASIRIKSRRDLLSLMFAAQQELEVYLCCGKDTLCKGSLSLGGLGTTNVLHSTVPLGTNSTDGPTVDVTVGLEQTHMITTPSSFTPSQAPPISTPGSSQGKGTPLPSAKRNLTQSFDEASQPALSLSSLSASGVGDTPTKGPASLHPETPPTEPCLLQPASTQPPAVTVPSIPAVTVPQPTTMTPTTYVTDRHGFGTALNINGNLTRLPSSTTGLVSVGERGTGTPSLLPDQTSVGKYSAPLPVPTGSIVNPGAPPKPFDTVSQSSERPHHFRFSIDLRSIHNLQLDTQHKCYLRYNYPFFGSAYPVLIQPPVIPTVGVDEQFSHSFCSFDFAVKSGQLEQYITQHPLCVEVWQSCDKSPDQIVGHGQVLLGSVLSHDKAKTENSVTRQVCSLRTPVTLPHPHPDAITVGHLNVVLILEDYGVVNGVVQESKEVATAVENDPPGDRVGSLGDGQPLVESQEYKVAMELELWKLSQQETFEEQLRSREATHMTKLGAELQRRESQRQALLKQKVDHYTSLETKLKDGLLQLQLQQRAVVDRETKLSQEKERVSQDKKIHHDEVQRSKLQLQSQYEQQLEIERFKYSELQLLVNSLKKQIRDLEVKVQSREAEFEAYRQQMLAKPESKLHAELCILQLEKSELDRKLTSLAKSKQHYKEQWSKSLAELASCRQKEQAAARDKLLTQQRELEAMRIHYMENEHQNSLKKQLNQVKSEVERLQEHTLGKPQVLTDSLHKLPSTQTIMPLPSAKEHVAATRQFTDANIARWIEERDILLQTGVYSSSDVTIQKLDSKIRQALQQPTE